MATNSQRLRAIRKLQGIMGREKWLETKSGQAAYRAGVERLRGLYPGFDDSDLQGCVLAAMDRVANRRKK